jgi:predicted phage replisome organizer
MAESKKYYWLKLKRDFFKRHDIRIIKKLPKGKECALFYLELMLESIDHEGQLRFSEEIPYDYEMLAAVTDTELEIVELAFDYLIKFKMVKFDEDKTIILPGVQQLIGSAVDNDAANRQRRSRERKKQAAAQCVTNVTENVTPCVTKDNESKRKRIEKDKDKELDKELDKEKEEKESGCAQVADLFNTLCPSLPPVIILSDSIKKDLKASLSKYNNDNFKQAFEKAESSAFLKGNNERKWTASFDWLIKEENIAKVLNGNFDDRISEEDKRFAEIEKFVFAKWEDEENPPKTAAEDENIRARAEALKQQFAAKV